MSCSNEGLSESTDKICYIVEALRWNSRENHSYVVGVYDDYNRAIKSADDHANYRGGKYMCTVLQCKLNNEVSSDWSEATLYQTAFDEPLTVEVKVPDQPR